MTRCLKCLDSFYERPSWSHILMNKQPSYLCYKCEEKIECINGPRCLSCSRSLDKLSKRLQKDSLCFDCIRWDKRVETKDLLERNYSLLFYNEFLKEWFAQFKFNGDAVAARYFSSILYKQYQRHYQEYTVAAIPLSERSLEEREFNQVELLIESWRCNTMTLGRIDREKQSKKSRNDRILLVQDSPFYVEEIAEKDLLNKVVLIDDIYTTGTTVRQAAKTLKKAGAQTVASLTVAR